MEPEYGECSIILLGVFSLPPYDSQADPSRTAVLSHRIPRVHHNHQEVVMKTEDQSKARYIASSPSDKPAYTSPTTASHRPSVSAAGVQHRNICKLILWFTRSRGYSVHKVLHSCWSGRSHQKASFIQKSTSKKKNLVPVQSRGLDFISAFLSRFVRSSLAENFPSLRAPAMRKAPW